MWYVLTGALNDLRAGIGFYIERISSRVLPWVPEIPRSRQPSTLAVTARGWRRSWAEIQSLVTEMTAAVRISQEECGSKGMKEGEIEIQKMERK